jgi:hypothetical protein
MKKMMIQVLQCNSCLLYMTRANLFTLCIALCTTAHSDSLCSSCRSLIKVLGAPEAMPFHHMHLHKR